MSYPDLELKVEKLRSDVYKIKERLYKLEDGRDEKVMPEGVDFSHTIPGKGYETATAKIKVSLDWYIRQFERVSKENEILKEDIAGAHERVKELEERNEKLQKLNDVYTRIILNEDE